eukprot:IDg14095t1
MFFDRPSGAFCARTQRTETFWPWGDSRDEFIRHIQIMTAGAVALRDGICVTTHPNIKKQSNIDSQSNVDHTSGFLQSENAKQSPATSASSVENGATSPSLVKKGVPSPEFIHPKSESDERETISPIANAGFINGAEQ